MTIKACPTEITFQGRRYLYGRRALLRLIYRRIKGWTTTMKGLVNRMLRSKLLTKPDRMRLRDICGESDEVFDDVQGQAIYLFDFGMSVPWIRMHVPVV